MLILPVSPGFDCCIAKPTAGNLSILVPVVPDDVPEFMRGDIDHRLKPIPDGEGWHVLIPGINVNVGIVDMGRGDPD